MNGQRLDWLDHVMIILISLGIGAVAGVLFLGLRWLVNLYY